MTSNRIFDAICSRSLSRVGDLAADLDSTPGRTTGWHQAVAHDPLAPEASVFTVRQPAICFKPLRIYLKTAPPYTQILEAGA